MFKMSDSLARLARPHGALLNSEEEDALLEEGGQSEFDSTEPRGILPEKLGGGEGPASQNPYPIYGQSL